MTRRLPERPSARAAGPELQVLAKWEDFTGWLLLHTARWPRWSRFSLCQRVVDHALDVSMALVDARYEPARRAELLRRANLALERMRLLLRLARASGLSSTRGFESAVRGVDEAGRMIHGWRVAIGERPEART